MFDGLKVRRAREADLERIMQIFDFARGMMRKAGNNAQWINGYPSPSRILDDIREETAFVVESADGIAGVFTFIVGEEPTYSEIDGAWPDDKPYGTIHRIAAAEGAKGIADTALDFCMRSGVNIRIDTHADNRPMLNWIAKHPFRYCGIIRVADGSPRKAFQLDVAGKPRN